MQFVIDLHRTYYAPSNSLHSVWTTAHMGAGWHYKINPEVNTYEVGLRLSTLDKAERHRKYELRRKEPEYFI